MRLAQIAQRVTRAARHLAQQDTSRWGYPGEETVATYPWYVSPQMVDDDLARIKAGQDPQVDRGCLNVTMSWIEEQECLKAGNPPVKYHGHNC